jgi:hypothetical protein
MAAAAAAPDEIPTYTKFSNLQMAQDSKVHFKNNDELPCSIMLPSATFMENGFVSS